MSDIESTTNIGENEELFNSLSRKMASFNPRTLDISTTNARLQHTDLNVASINLQTMILSIILVILVTIAFVVHLKE